MIKHHSKPQPTTARTTTTKAGWRVNEWAADVGVSRAYVYNLLAASAITSVKADAARIITTTPAQYLASLADKAV